MSDIIYSFCPYIIILVNWYYHNNIFEFLFKNIIKILKNLNIIFKNTTGFLLFRQDYGCRWLGLDVLWHEHNPIFELLYNLLSSVSMSLFSSSDFSIHSDCFAAPANHRPLSDPQNARPGSPESRQSTSSCNRRRFAAILLDPFVFPTLSSPPRTCLRSAAQMS